MKHCLSALIMCLILLVGKAQQASAPEVKEFELYWKKVHAAIMKKDYTAVSRFIEFPLVVRKSISDTAVTTVDAKEFANFFSAYLDMPARDSFINKYGLLKNRRDLNDDDKSMISEESATMEDFEFQKVDGQWKMVYVYATQPE
ncbi:hypothetical protein [Chitinophaga deserti]|uniref:hypothetical protein n=1 Tax=Chitinophaga deserti TaxID=2164099 RepID=UPI0013007129|nr:hypothetical protein [Chitinophaga deserti]